MSCWAAEVISLSLVVDQTLLRAVFLDYKCTHPENRQTCTPHTAPKGCFQTSDLYKAVETPHQVVGDQVKATTLPVNDHRCVLGAKRTRLYNLLIAEVA
jgi:hypothetical protein